MTTLPYEKANMKRQDSYQSGFDQEIGSVNHQVRFESNPKIEDADQDVKPIKGKKIHTNERTEKKFDLEVDEENHRSIDSFNFGEGNCPSNLVPRVLEFMHAEAEGDEEFFYRFGVIDFLQAYTRRKKLETLLLRKRFSKKPKNCFSCVEPPIYADRFYDFLSENLFTN